MRALIRGLDAVQRKAQGVYEFTDDPDCVFRVQVRRTHRPLVFAGETIAKGERVLYLHLWNEQIPHFPAEGADFGWAVGTQKLILASLGAVARHMQEEAQLAEVRVVGGVTALFSPGDGSGTERLMKRLGFIVQDSGGPLGRFAEFWENLYATWLMWTFNPGSLRNRKVLFQRRAEIWMTADEFLRRYGSK